jgi:hypothetical protein
MLESIDVCQELYVQLMADQAVDLLLRSILSISVDHLFDQLADGERFSINARLPCLLWIVADMSSIVTLSRIALQMMTSICS